MSEKKERTKAIIGTVLFHIGLLAFMILMGLRTPLPLPGEEGVEVNLGYYDVGSGIIQPDIPKIEDKSVLPVEKKDANEKSSEEQILTQNDEDIPQLENTQKKEKDLKKDSEETTDEKKDAEDELAEKTQKEPELKVDPKALYPGKGDKSSEGQSQGETNYEGDQGKPTGSTDSDGYDGSGGVGDGVSYSLGGRKASHLPKPSYNSPEQGRVVVKIWVDRYGKVTKAISGTKGTTVSDPSLKRMAKQAALRAKFSAKPDAPEEQIGSITYIFIRQN